MGSATRGRPGSKTVDAPPISIRRSKPLKRGDGPRRGRLPRVSEDRVRVRIGADGIATVTMVRSDKHNALDQAMFEGLVKAAEQVAGGASVRAVVLHGEGKSFCSGLDIASFMAGEGGTEVLLARDDDRLANFAQRDLRLVVGAGASDRSDSRQLLRRRSADRARCRHPDR